MTKWQKLVLTLIELAAIVIFGSVITILGPYTSSRFIPSFSLYPLENHESLIIDLLFWGSVVLLGVVVVLIVVTLCVPQKKMIILLSDNKGKLELSKKAVEGCVHSVIDLNQLMERPSIKVSMTKRKLSIKVTGTFRRTSDLKGKTDDVANKIKQDLIMLLGIEEDIQLQVSMKNISNHSKLKQTRVI